MYLARLLPLVAALAACGESSPSAGRAAGGTALPSPGQPRVAPDATELPATLVCGEKRNHGCFQEIPGGTVRLGAQAADPTAPGYDPAAGPDEAVREVTVAPFFVQNHEVGRKAWQLCVAAEWCPPLDEAIAGPAPTEPKAPERAVTGVTASQAERYCAWFAGRLPTEAEWELAARGLEGRRFPWGDEEKCAVRPGGPGKAGDADAASTSCELDGPALLTELRDTTPERVFGLGGNVAEWTADAWTPAPEEADAEALPARVVKGGRWTASDPLAARAAARMAVPPDARRADVGFRCVFPGAAR